jgi:hypothetical protein
MRNEGRKSRNKNEMTPDFASIIFHAAKHFLKSHPNK